MLQLILLLASCSHLAIPASAQNDELNRNHITVGIGPAIPVCSDANYLRTAPLLMVGYGYRFTRFFQVDGSRLALGSANHQNAELTGFGQVQDGDHEYMIPSGGRYFITSPFKRIGSSDGGSAVCLDCSETTPSGGYYSSGHYTYTSLGEWGGYGLGNASYFFGDNRNFHVGTTFEFSAASTNWSGVGDVPALHTTDHWSNLYIEFGRSF
jgi:hypothetical protein